MKDGQWYPKNMARTAMRLRQDLKIVDLAIELIDARIPLSSSNPSFSKYLSNKNRLTLLHKADLAEAKLTQMWLDFFKINGRIALPFSVYHKKYLNNLLKLLNREEAALKKGRFKRPLRLMIIGIPNVGKSTLINHLVKKAATRTGNQPGITRGRQWVRLNPRLELLDTPGILMPEISEDNLWPLAAVGAILPSRLDLEQVAVRLIKVYLAQGKEKYLLQHYRGLKIQEATATFAAIGFLNGCILPGEKLDGKRTAALLLKDFQSGALGRVTIEKPDFSEEQNAFF